MDFDHEIILKKIENLENFFKDIGFKKTKELGKTWDLDSYIKYQPIGGNYTIEFKGENRVLLSVEIGIVSGLLFVLSGRIGVSVYESIQTDYDFNVKYDNCKIILQEYRNWSISKILDQIHLKN